MADINLFILIILCFDLILTIIRVGIKHLAVKLLLIALSLKVIIINSGLIDYIDRVSIYLELVILLILIVKLYILGIRK